jgi:magnesium transporter
MRTNEIVRLLTIVSTIFIPLTFIAGVYGMNFERSASPFNMPELGWPYGYPLVLLLMALVAGGMIFYFKWRRWL